MEEDEAAAIAKKLGRGWEALRSTNSGEHIVYNRRADIKILRIAALSNGGTMRAQIGGSACAHSDSPVGALRELASVVMQQVKYARQELSRWKEHDRAVSDVVEKILDQETG